MGYDFVFTDGAVKSVGKNREDQDSWEFNLHGMTSTAVMMGAYGMLNLDAQPPEWPEITTPTDLPDDEFEDWFDENFNSTLQIRFPGVPGIPAFKFASNDGWFVWPSEIDSALEQLWKRQRVDIEPEWFTAWIAWMKRAANHGGFRVY